MVTSEYLKDQFKNIEIWLQKIEKEKGIKEFLFTWNELGVRKVKRNYDYLFDEYKGLQGAIEFIMKSLEKVA